MGQADTVYARLSQRLRAVAGLARPCRVLADIGTDHAYLPIYLVGSGIAERAIAMDLRTGPLEQAEKNIAALCEDPMRVQTRLSDGLKELKEDEADAIVIAGMGGALTVRILQADMETAQRARFLILQPQSELPMVRAFLWQHGWFTEDENMILEDGKFYPMMRIVFDRQRAQEQMQMSGEGGLHYGPVLIRERNPVLYSFLQFEKHTKQKILSSLQSADGDKAKSRQEELKAALERNEEICRLFQNTAVTTENREGDDADKRINSADH